jgi:hypothetical protein
VQVEIGNMTKEKGEINNMNKGIVIQNLTNNYGKYGITREVLEPLIDDGVAEGFTYDLIYLSLEAELSKLAGQEFFCTSEDMARAFNVSEDEMNRIIEEAREELIEAGENPDEYFKTVETTRFMV